MNGLALGVTRAAASAGIDDAIQLTREALLTLPDDRRAQSITRHQVEDALNALAGALEADASDLAAHAATLTDGALALASEQADEAHSDMLFWAEAAQRAIESWRVDLAQTEASNHALDQRLLALEATTRAMALAMDFDFLLDPERKLLAIGYRADEGVLDSSCYDLLASEARLASFFAIAKNDIPTRHWFRLGRSVTSIGYGAALISWSGSMFEYLMPSLVMRAPAGSLLERTNRLIVRRQIAYGAALDTPWGISESAYNARDLELTYQYSNFGVPGLGLKRGLSENVVIAPYATGLAAMIDPQAATRNFARLAAAGARGRYGFYEALDYTPSRLPEGAEVAIVRAFMAHHQGMTIVAIANVLFDGRMRARFHAEASVRATELLLQERTPRDVSIAHPRAEEVKTAARIGNAQAPEVRRLHTTQDATPQTHLLANARYAVMLTAAGSGYSRWLGQGITRWREDATRDDTGSYIFLRDVASGSVWSATLPAQRRRTRQLRSDVRRRPRGVHAQRWHDHHGLAGARFTRRRCGSAAAVDHRTAATTIEISMSRPIASSFLHRPLPTARIRPSRNSSCRPSTRPSWAHCWQLAAHAPRTSRESGRRTTCSSKAKYYARRSTKPTGPASSAADARSTSRSQ